MSPCVHILPAGLNSRKLLMNANNPQFHASIDTFFFRTLLAGTVWYRLSTPKAPPTEVLPQHARMRLARSVALHFSQNPQPSSPTAPQHRAKQSFMKAFSLLILGCAWYRGDSSSCQTISPVPQHFTLSLRSHHRAPGEPHHRFACQM